MTFFRVLLSTLREIFEETAYDRFCQRENLRRDRSSYAMFLRELNCRKTNRARCC